MTDADGATSEGDGDEPGARRAPEPVLRAILDKRGLRAAARPRAPLRAAVEAICHPALWRGASAQPDRRRGGLLFGAWRLGWPLWPQPVELAAFLRFEPAPSAARDPIDPPDPDRAADPTGRVAALIFSQRDVAEASAAILSPGAAWFADLGWEGPAAFDPTADPAADEDRWLAARPPVWPAAAGSPRAAAEAQTAGADAASLLRRLQDEVGAEAEAIDPGGATRPIGAVWGASDDEAAFWRAVGALSAALPRPMRAFVSAASGFHRTPDGVAVAHGPAIDAGRLEGGEAALAKLGASGAPPPRFPGAPGPASAALRRWLRDIERPAAAAEIARYLLAPQSGRPAAPPGQRGRIARLRRAVAMAEEDAILGASAELLEDVDAARLAGLITEESGVDADAAWDALRRTEPSRFYWSALTLRAMEAVDGAAGEAEPGPIRRLAELARLIDFDERVGAAIAEPGAPERPTTPLSGPAFKRRLARAAAQAPELVVDDPAALLEPQSGAPARWIGPIARAADALDEATRIRLAEAAALAAQAAEIADLPGRWGEAAAALGAPPGRKDAIFLAIDLGVRLARAFDRGAVAGAAFWRRAYEIALRELFEADRDGVGGDLRVIRERLRRQTPGLAAAVAIAEAVAAAATAAPPAPAAPPRPPAGRKAPGPEQPSSEPPGSEPSGLSPRAAAFGGGGGARGRLSGSSDAAADRDRAPDWDRPTPAPQPEPDPAPTASRAAPVAARPAGRSQDVTLARARLAHWRENFEQVLEERYQGQSPRSRVSLSRDGRTDLDADALEALGRLGADLHAADALDDAAATDIAWTIRQFINLEFDPSAAPLGPPEPPEIAQAWAAFADGETADDLKRPETFFLFFITKVAQRSAARGVKPDRVVLAFKRFLAAPKSMFLIGDRKITAPYPGWLRDHAFETNRKEDAARLAGVDDGVLIRRLHRAFLFLACIRVFLDAEAAREVGAKDWKLWQPISTTPEQLALFDPHPALVDRLERFLLSETEDGVLYARIYEKIAGQNNLYHADGLGHLSRQIRRRNNAPLRPNPTRTH